MKKLIIFLSLVIILLAVSQTPKILLIFERTLPLIELVHEPKGLSATPQELSIHVSDAGAGLNNVSIVIGGKQVLDKNYETGNQGPSIYDDTIKFNLDAKALGLKDNQTAEITVRVSDSTLVPNVAEKKLQLKTDFIRPRVEVVSVQHNGFAGGALMVFYKNLSEDIVKSGVKVRDRVFEGFSASLLDPVFEKHKELNFSLFPIPVDFNGDTENIQVVAFDGVGNDGVVAFYQKIRNKMIREEDMPMKRDFFVKKVNELLPKFLSETKQGSMASDAQDMTNEELAEGFKKVNQEYRADLETRLKSFVSQSEKSLLWNGVFEKPLPAKPTATFADKRRYSVEGVSAGGSTHMGVDLAQSANSEVGASNRGKVIFADYFGIYGNAVIIDHGFGLMTLYGHLSSINVNVGDMVEKLQKIGRTGDTGLAGGDHLHFEFRLLGQSVTPFEWLDPLWIKSHIGGQIEEIKKQLS